MVSLKLSSKCWMEATEQASEHWWQFSMGLGCAGHVLCQAPQLITSSVKMSKCLWWHYLGVCSSPKSLVLPLHWWSVISVSKIKENPSWIPLLPWIFHFVTRTQKKLLYPWWTRTDSQISLKKYLCFFSSLDCCKWAMWGRGTRSSWWVSRSTYRSVQSSVLTAR